MKGQLILIPGRSSKQGVGLNKGKLKEEYIRVTTTLELSFEDAQELGLETADIQVKVLKEGKLPIGYAFIPYGPPSSCLFDGETCGTGMPASKGMTIDVEFIKKGVKKKTALPPKTAVG